MIKKTMLVFLFLILINSAFNQQNNICYVRFSDLNNNGWSYVQWYNNTKLTFVTELTYDIKEFQVQVDGKFFKTTDTIRFRKEYLEFKKKINELAKQDKQAITEREYNSNVLRRSCYLRQETKYFVLDTIANMSSWEILDDTLNILSFTCQKAITIFNGKKFIAYFTTKLPFPAGPRNFRGLPGLILKVDDEKGDGIYLAIEIKYPYTGKVPVLENDGILVSQKQYQGLVEESNKKAMEKLSNFLMSPTIKQN